jgi:murein DD-endopeptidase MepM/ murein hydrolase activator NlpD|tara:strand:+ start:3163 stop:4131 length:969 start_codon:yes stop_codon:yes gene_type:complete
MKNNYLILMVLLVSLLHPHLTFGQESDRENCDTIWIQDGKEYGYNPLKKLPAQRTPVAITDNSDFRKLVDSLGTHAKLTFDRDELSKQILKNDPLFKESWFPKYVFPSLNPIAENDSAYITLIQGQEEFYYNYWTSFNSSYGPRWGRMHRGIDLGLHTGDTLRSTFNGIVRYAQFNKGGYGNCVVIRHFNGLETLYAHLDKLLVVSGQLVFSSDVIGLGGTTGRSDGPHLHFETRYKGRSFNPLKVFDKDSRNLHKNHVVLRKKDITDPYISKPKKKYHRVKAGETLSHIARKYGTSVSKLQKLNGIRNANLISAGQRIRVK